MDGFTNEIEIVEATSVASIASVRTLCREYAAWLAFVEDPAHVQAAADDAAALPGPYVAPGGCLFLAERGGAGAGCAAIKRLDPTTCEMKRLFVRPEFRGHRLGRELIRACVAKGRSLGYARMRLETLTVMAGARRSYAAEGFRSIGPYGGGPVVGREYYELDLA